MHDPDQPCIAEELLAKLIPALIRSGDIAESTVLELADEMIAQAEDATITRADELKQMATALRAWAIMSTAPKHSDYKADRRRKRFRVIESEPEA
jgi:hypothetical protein